jgi:hypothetical protein
MILSFGRSSMTLLASTSTAEWMTASATVAAAAFALIATFVAVWQLRRIANDLTLAAQANVSQAYAVVSDRMAVLRDLLANDDAALYPYFYSGRDPLKKRPCSLRKPPNQDVLELACEAIVDFADVCVVQRKSIPHEDMDWSSWDAYFRYLYQHSPFLKGFLRGKKDFYPDYLTSVFGYIVVRKEHTGEVVSEWQVEELKDGLKGYSWMRTWLITRFPKKGDTSGVTRTIEAAVQAPGEHSTSVEVSFTWPNVDATELDELESVISWVLWQLKSSSRWRTAKILVKDQDPRTARLMSLTWRRRLFGPRGPQRERYLPPKIPFGSR